MSEALLACSLQCHCTRPARRLVLDGDATDDETHGYQHRAFFQGYSDEHCSLPLLVLAQAEAKGDHALLGALLQPGNVHGSHRAMAMVKAIVTGLRRAFP